MVNRTIHLGVSWTSDAAETTAFLARTSGLDATHTNAYRDLINGGVTDGWFQKMDVLHVFATQNQATALLNLPNATYTMTTVGSIVFNTDRSFSLTATTGKVVSTFDGSGTIQYTRDAAHISYWDRANIPSGSLVRVNASSAYIPFTGDSLVYMRVNDPGSGGYSVADTRGLNLGNRSSSTGREAYFNGVSANTYGSVASTALGASALEIMGDNVSPYTSACAACSVGGSLTSAQQLAFYNRLRTYMTAVGAP